MNQAQKYKTVRIHPNILINDLKLKVNFAKEMLNKAQTVKVVMAVDESNMSEGKNVLFTVNF